MVAALFIGILLTQLYVKRKGIKYPAHLLLVVLTVSFSFFIFSRHYEANMDTYYVKSYLSETEKYRNNDSVNVSNQCSISSYNIRLIEDDKLIFNVDISLEEIKKRDVTFYINETFEVSTIKQSGLQIPFKQKGNRIDLSLSSIENQTLTFIYSSENGTSLNPIQKNYMFLPYFFNWLPSTSNNGDYFVRHHSNLEFNPQKDVCYGIKEGDFDDTELFVQHSINKECLTIVKGDFVEGKQDGSMLYYPKVWSGNVGKVDEYSEIMNRATLLFNQVFKDNKTLSYESLLIIPKYEIHAQPSFNDIWLQDNHQIILVDPFLDINQDSLFKKISKLSIFNLVYSLLRDEITDEDESKVEFLSMLFAIYFMEKNHISKEEMYLDYYLALTEEKEIRDFLNLDLSQKEDKLIQVYQSLQIEKER